MRNRTPIALQRHQSRDDELEVVVVGVRALYLAHEDGEVRHLSHGVTAPQEELPQGQVYRALAPHVLLHHVLEDCDQPIVLVHFVFDSIL